MKTICPFCGSDALTETTGVFEMPVPENIPGGPIRIENATWEACGTCGEVMVPDPLGQAIAKVRYRRLGLLSPEEIRQIRQRTGLTAVEMAQILGAGDKSYTRWENGRSLQSKATDTLLRLVDQCPELFSDIDAQRDQNRQASLKEYFEGLSSVKGASRYAMAAHGDPLSQKACDALRGRLQELREVAKNP